MQLTEGEKKGNKGIKAILLNRLPHNLCIKIFAKSIIFFIMLINNNNNYYIKIIVNNVVFAVDIAFATC